jgi:hypothetical protein
VKLHSLYQQSHFFDYFSEDNFDSDLGDVAEVKRSVSSIAPLAQASHNISVHGEPDVYGPNSATASGRFSISFADASYDAERSEDVSDEEKSVRSMLLLSGGSSPDPLVREAAIGTANHTYIQHF